MRWNFAKHLQEGNKCAYILNSALYDASETVYIFVKPSIKYQLTFL